MITILSVDWKMIYTSEYGIFVIFPMLIKPDALNHWTNHFYGYGSWHARLWFVAHEESGGDHPEEVGEKLDFFYDVHRDATNATLCDIREMYQCVGVRWEGPKAGLFKNRYAYRFGDRAALNKVWENLIHFSCGYKQRELPNTLDYQKYTFAAPSSPEALIRLYPLPGASHHGWNYNWLDLGEEFSFLESRTSYQDHVYQQRIHSILNAIQVYKPELVLMYGMSNINTLKDSIREFFPGVKFILVKSIKQKIPQHHRTNLNGTHLLISTQIPALRHNRIKTGFDWYAFGRGYSKYFLQIKRSQGWAQPFGKELQLLLRIGYEYAHIKAARLNAPGVSPE